MDAPQISRIYPGYVPWNTCQAGLAVCLLVYSCCHVVLGETTRNPVVEGFESGSVTLPCTLTPNGDLEWRKGGTLRILLKVSGGPVFIDETVYKDVVSLEGGTDLRISPLNMDRDNDGIFRCLYLDRPKYIQETPVRVLGKLLVK